MRRKSASRVRRPWFASAAVSAMRTSTSAAWVPRRASAKRAPEKVDPDRGIDEKVAHVGRWRAFRRSIFRSMRPASRLRSSRFVEKRAALRASSRSSSGMSRVVLMHKAYESDASYATGRRGAGCLWIEPGAPRRLLSGWASRPEAPGQAGTGISPPGAGAGPSSFWVTVAGAVGFGGSGFTGGRFATSCPVMRLMIA